jgi:hypothetical protein
MTGKPLMAWSPQEGPQAALIDCPFPEVFWQLSLHCEAFEEPRLPRSFAIAISCSLSYL